MSVPSQRTPPTLPPNTRRAARHAEKRRPWEVPLIIACLVILGILLAASLWAFKPRETRTYVPTPVEFPTPLNQTPSPTGPEDTDTPEPVQTSDRLVIAARKIKPLEDLVAGDRVLYQGHLCYWREWIGTVSTSKIECKEGEPFQIQTARLTPVERKERPEESRTQHP